MGVITGSGQELAELIYQLRCKCISRHEVIREETELSPVEYRVIIALSENDQLIGVEFAKLLNLSPSRSSRVIEKMSDKGFLKVTKSREDKRLMTIGLGEKGKALKKQITNEMNACNTRLEELLPESERVKISETLKGLIDLL